MSTALRPIEPADHAFVLDLNQVNVALLAPLDEERLIAMIAVADAAVIIVDDGRDVGFVITFAEGADYASINYAWFSARHERFVYLDRVVIDASARRTGVGRRAYELLEAAAARRAPVLCLEVNSNPPNEPSLAFHAGRGFTEVGRQEFDGHEVALLEKDLRAPGS